MWSPIRISRSLRFRPSAGSLAAITVSLALHAGAFLARGHAGAGTLPSNATPIEISLESEPQPAPTEVPFEVEPAAPVRAASAPASHRHAYPTAPAHASEPHDPALVHPPLPLPSPSPASAPASDPAPGPEPESAPATAAPNEPAHFVLRRGNARAAGSGSAVAGSDAGVDAPTTFSESAVDVPARLLKSAPLSYPQLARAAEFEGEVVVELVVGSEGSVLSARALTAHGLGLEAAALSAVQNYRFSAALRQGRPVQVRMRWTVTFRLS